MACRYTIGGKELSAIQFEDMLREMPVAEAAKFMPNVR